MTARRLTAERLDAIAKICGYQSAKKRLLADWIEILYLASYAGYDVTKRAKNCGIEILALEGKRETLSLMDANSTLLQTHNHHLADFENQLATAIAI